MPNGNLRRTDVQSGRTTAEHVEATKTNEGEYAATSWFWSHAKDAPLEAIDKGAFNREEFADVLGETLVHNRYYEVSLQVERLRDMTRQGLRVDTKALGNISETLANFNWSEHPECSLTISWTLESLPATWKAKEHFLLSYFGRLLQDGEWINPFALRASEQGRKFQPNRLELLVIEPEATPQRLEEARTDRKGVYAAGLEMFDHAIQHPVAFRRLGAPAWQLRGFETSGFGYESGRHHPLLACHANSRYPAVSMVRAGQNVSTSPAIATPLIWAAE